MSKRAVLYARVSTDEQAERGYSIPTQLEACNDYATEHGYTVEAEITDDYTGTVLDRPGFTKVMEFIESRSVDALIVYSADR